MKLVKSFMLIKWEIQRIVDTILSYKLISLKININLTKL